MEQLKLCLCFRDSNKQLDNYTVKFDIKQTGLAQHWLASLIKNFFNTNHPIEKTYCLQGWQTSWKSSYSRNVEVLCEKLNKAIADVNKGMIPKGYPKIELNFTLDVLKTKKFRTYMNEIHHHFELLIGQSWNESPWYKKADNKTRIAIRMLNNYCHEIEKNVENIKMNNLLFRLSPYYLRSYVTVGLNGVDSNNKHFDWTDRKDSITEDEYNDFQQIHSWGNIELFYSQLGKSHVEAWFDKDEHIDRSNISSYKFITGEFVVHFLAEDKEQFSNEFLTWLKDNDFDINDKTLGIGCPVVAEIDLQGQTKTQILTQLRARDDLFAISLEDSQGAVVHYKEYDYTWKDEEGWKQ
jgi:hypothetical protein